MMRTMMPTVMMMEKINLQSVEMRQPKGLQQQSEELLPTLRWVFGGGIAGP